jgi:hypothetical protein
MNIALKPELEKLIDDEVKAGRSTDPAEFLNRAVYHFVVARDLGQEFTPEEVDRQIAEGLEELDANGGIDGEEAFRQLRAYTDSRRQTRP